MCVVDEHKKKCIELFMCAYLGSRNVLAGKIFLLQATAVVMYDEYV